MKVKNLNSNTVVIRKGSFSFTIEPGKREITEKERKCLSPYICHIKKLQLIDDEDKGKKFMDDNERKECKEENEREEFKEEFKEEEDIYTTEYLNSLYVREIKNLAVRKGCNPPPSTKAKAIEFLAENGYIKDVSL